jgi:pyruvate dehydrogenase E2 component (dihydrolipoamide acetyltransferase)
MPEVTMPRLSDTMQEGTIAQWLKKPGDQVKKGDVMAEIETDKATMDLEAYDTGVLEQILVQEGQTVPIGQAIAIIGSGKGAQSQPAPTGSSPASPMQTESETVASTAQPVASTPSPNTDERKSQPREDTTSRAPQPATGAAEQNDGNMIKVSPLARHIAEEHGIDLRQIQGTGPGGRIVRDDIEDYVEQRTAPAAPATTPVVSRDGGSAPPAPTIAAQPIALPPDVEAVPMSRVQSLIGRRLTESKQTIPHFYVSSEVDVTDLLEMRQTFNASAGEGGMKVSVNDLIVKACALALEKFPEVNSSIQGDQYLRHKQINIGIAVDVPGALVVPVIRDANIKGVRSIAREAKALIEKAHNNKLSTADLEGGTFSVSNLGMMDASNFIAVINPPQAAILAVAAARKQFVPIDNQPVIRDLMTLTMSADHRIIYGATVARFLQEVKRLLQNPYSLLG